jgi:hypothetical protein
MPLTMVDRTPRLRLGAEYHFNNAFGYCLEIGVGNTIINKNKLSGSLWEDGYHLFEIRPEFKYYFNDTGTDNASLYCSVELFFITMNSRFKQSYYHPDNSSLVTYYDEATFRKMKYGSHIKGGMKQVFFKHLSVDIYAGLGVANRQIAYSDVVNPVTGEDYPFEEWLPQTEKYEGENTIFHLTAGCKIGWMF